MCPSVVVYVTVSVSVTNVQAYLVRVHDCNLRPYAKTRITMLITALHSGQLPVTAYLRANSCVNAVDHIVAPSPSNNTRKICIWICA